MFDRTALFLLLHSLATCELKSGEFEGQKNLVNSRHFETSCLFFSLPLRNACGMPVESQNDCVSLRRFRLRLDDTPVTSACCLLSR